MKTILTFAIAVLALGGFAAGAYAGQQTNNNPEGIAAYSEAAPEAKEKAMSPEAANEVQPASGQQEPGHSDNARYNQD